MKVRLNWSWNWFVLLLFATGLIFLSTAERLFANQVGSESSCITAISTSQLLGGRDRYLTYVSTDKPIYKAGDTFFARGALLHAISHKPIAMDSSRNTARVRIQSAKGVEISQGNAPVRDSVWAFSWKLPANLPGGEYRVLVDYPSGGYAPAERNFEVRSYRAPRLRSQISFLKDGYGPGEKVSATLKVTRAEGGVPSGARVTCSPRVDGNAIDSSVATVDANGLCAVSFDLPEQIERGEGTLALTIEDGGVVENASKTIPILVNCVDLKLYPEGGELIAGLPNRVYFQARQGNGKPADISGRLIWNKGKLTGTVTSFKTEHEGRGRFKFTPLAGMEYSLRIEKPTGIEKAFALPEINPRGVTITTDSNVFRKGEPITVKLNGIDGSVFLTLKKQEEIVAYKKVIFEASETTGKEVVAPPGSPKTFQTKTVSFFIPYDTDGVMTVTAWDEDDKPLAERLVFREPSQTINVSLRSDKTKYVPGAPAQLKVKATNERGEPVSTVVHVCVTDDSILELKEDREKAPDLPVMIYLEPDVLELADAKVYLNKSDPIKAAMATDLLLGTQGWRRFVLVHLEDFLKEYGDKARRVLALRKVPAWDLYRHRTYKGARFHFSSNNYIEPGKRGHTSYLNLPEVMIEREEIGRVEGPRDMNMFQVEPTVIDERHYSSGRAERHQRTSPTLPYGIVHVREYAHKISGTSGPNERVDFAETLYWNPALKTDSKTGEATVDFHLSQSITSFKVFADAFSGDGAIGTGVSEISCVKPVFAEAKVPLEVTEGDLLELPINVVNSTESPISDLSLLADLNGDSTLEEMKGEVETLLPGSRLRRLQKISVGKIAGKQRLTLVAKAGDFKDQVVRDITVQPAGFPIEESFGGVIQPNSIVKRELLVPDAMVPGSMQARVAVYPTPLSRLDAALERMIVDPHGCFEQTSSTTYPLTMAQQYFLSHSGIDPSWIRRSRTKLDAGYKKLTSYWCKDRGYECFGHDPSHEALTAYGLLLFNDMKKVYDVDQKMVALTKEWLMKQRDGQGGFKRNRRGGHHWLVKKDCSNAYILWSLMETGESPGSLEKEIAEVKRAALTSDDSYVVALAANALHIAGDKTTAKKLMFLLASKQKSDGSVDGVKSSMVGSSGESLLVEGTALSSIAWLREPEFAGNVAKSMKFLADSCKGGRYGSTQATVLSLRAIVENDKRNAHPKAPGKIRVSLDGKPIGSWVHFDKSSRGTIELPDLSKNLTSGKHIVEIEMKGGSALPYTFASNYNTLTPKASKKCKVKIAVNLAQSTVLEGASTDAMVTVLNLADEAVPSPVAIVGIPGGLEPRYDQLKELVKLKKIDSYEVKGRDIVLYWRSLRAKAKLDIPLSLVAAVPGVYKGPASRAYLYYCDEFKHWVDGSKVKIVAKK